MKINTITATGLKGTGFRHQLKPITFITGDNASGKTTITDAIKLTLFGKHPDLGSKGNQIMKLGSDRIETEATLDGTGPLPGTIRRRWIRKGKSITTDHDADDEALAAINPVALDFSQFAQAKPTERQRILEAVMGNQHPAEAKQAIEQRITELTPEQLMALQAETETMPETFQAMEQAASGAAKAALQDTKRIKGALEQTIIDEATREAAASPTAVADMEAAKQLVTRRTEAKAKAEQIVDVQQERVMRAPDEPTDKPLPPEIEQELRDQLALDRTTREKNLLIQQQNETARQRIKQLETEHEVLLEQSQGFQIPTEPPHNPTKEEVEQLRQHAIDLDGEKRQAELARNIAQAERQKLKNEQEKLAAENCCPTCGTAGSGFYKAISEIYAPKISHQASQVESWQKRVDRLTRDHKEALEHFELMERYRRTWSMIEDLQKAEKVRQQIAAAQKTIQAETPTKIAELEDQLQRNDRIKQDWRDFERYAAPTRDEQEAAKRDLTEARARLQDAQDSLRDLERQEADYRAALAAMSRQTRLQGELEAAKGTQQAMKNLAGWAKQKSMEATEAALQPILKPANQIINRVIDGKVEIDGTEIGIRRGERFLPLEVLSGAEAAALTVAFQTAIASQTPLPIVIVDELSRMTRKRKNQLVLNLGGAIDHGILEQVILIDHDQEWIKGAATNSDTLVEV